MYDIHDFKDIEAAVKSPKAKSEEALFEKKFPITQLKQLIGKLIGPFFSILGDFALGTFPIQKLYLGCYSPNDSPKENWFYVSGRIVFQKLVRLWAGLLGKMSLHSLTTVSKKNGDNGGHLSMQMVRVGQSSWSNSRWSWVAALSCKRLAYLMGGNTRNWRHRILFLVNSGKRVRSSWENYGNFAKSYDDSDLLDSFFWVMNIDRARIGENSWVVKEIF